MAPALRGDHWQVLCGDCGLGFALGADHPPRTADVLCPNCGYRENRLPTEIMRGDRVTIDRWPWAPAVRRWDLVALQSPQDGAWSVKRVVGLPGEHVALEHGDVYVNGEIAQKSLADFRRMAVFVHHDGYRPRLESDLPDRWSNRSGQAGAAGAASEVGAAGAAGAVWKRTPAGYECTPENSESAAAPAWLDYRHWRTFEGAGPRTGPLPILDDDAYHPGRSRTLVSARDLWLTFRAQLAPHAALYVKYDDGRSTAMFQLDARAARIAASPGERIGEHAETAPWTAPAGVFECEFGVIDQQAFVIIDRQEVLATQRRLRFDGARESAGESLTPFSLGITGGHVRVEHLCISRDVHYLPPLPGLLVSGEGARWEAPGPLARDQWLVLGDNPSISLDSRDFGPVPRESILGPVYLLTPR